jgi:L-lactate dehydrogenase (cytochrome)
MDQHARYPAISDLKARARQRIPHFVWEFFDSATGSESVLPRNRAALDRVLFRPAALRGEITPELARHSSAATTRCPSASRRWGCPGWSGPMRNVCWRATRAAAGIPYGLSTVATRTPEDLGGAQGDQGWFQMYPPRDPGIRADMLPARGMRGFTRWS